VIFKPELAAKVMRGEKTVTRRLVSDNPRSPWFKQRTWYTMGKVFTVNPGRGAPNVGHGRVISADLQPLHVLRHCAPREADAEARLEGFEDASAFWEAWSEINGWGGGEIVWRIQFEVVDVAPDLMAALEESLLDG
jgi:hypothetical protein